MTDQTPIQPAIPNPNPAPAETPAAPLTAATVGEKIYDQPNPQAIEKASGEDGNPAPVVEGGNVEAPADTATPPPEGESKPASDPLDVVPSDASGYKIEFSEGITPDAASLTDLQTFAFENSLKPSQVQSLAGLYEKSLKANHEAWAAASTEGFRTIVSDWQKEVDTFPEYAPDQKAATELSLNKIIDELGGDKLREAFNVTGAGSNPAIVRAFLDIRNILLEGEATPTGNPASSKAGKSLGDQIYGNKN